MPGSLTYSPLHHKPEAQVPAGSRARYTPSHLILPCSGGLGAGRCRGAVGAGPSGRGRRLHGGGRKQLLNVELILTAATQASGNQGEC